MRNRAYLLVALLGLLTFALAPGIAAAAGQGQNLTEIALASDAAARATAVSGPVINVTPLSYDFGAVNIGSSAMTTFTITNTGDSDLHISGATPPSASFSASFGSLTVAAGGSTTMDVTYAPSAGVNESGALMVNSDDPHGPFNVIVAGQGNAAPTLSLDPAGPSYTAPAFVPFSIHAMATDANDQIDEAVTFTLSPAAPPGATFDTNTGMFSWTPSPADANTYNLTICAVDLYGLMDCQAISITVTAGNNPPVANAGGPYDGATGQPVAFNGSGSSDPDGNALSFAWDFGDGSTGTGATPSHTYSLANNYLATLTVTDDGLPPLSNSASAGVKILDSITGSATAKLSGATMRVSGGGVQQMGIELPPPNQPTNIDPNTITMTYSGSTIGSDPKTASIGDLDKDGIPEMVISFTRSDMNLLFGGLPNNSTVTLTMNAKTTTATGAIPIIATGTFKIKNTGPGAPVSAFASPNPFNPETAVSYTMQQSGRVSIRIYSIEGRLVKTLRDEFTSAGTHEVRWNGMDNAGRQVPSGMYFVKTETANGSSIFKLALLK